MRLHDEILLYGLRVGTKNELVHIDDAANGRHCNCECPHCGAPLVARNQGEGGKYRQNIHHFAHATGYEPCGKGGMSALHILAQQLIQEESKVLLPAYKGKYVQHDAKLQVFDEVKLEEPFKDEVSRRRPDCTGKVLSEGIEIWVEIYCTNPINEERRADIIRRKQHCIEIDFSDLLGTDYTKESIRDHLLNKSDDRKWICHPEWDAEEDKKEDEERAKQEAERRRQEEEQRKIDEQARLQWEEKRRKYEESMRKQAEAKHQQEEKLRRQEEERLKKIEETREELPTSESMTNFYKKEVKILETQRATDWVMYVKVIYSEKDALNALYDMLRSDYAKVNLANSHIFVQQELYLKVNELLPRTDLIVDVTKTYLQLLLVIWVLNKLNHSQNQNLSKIFVENQDTRNAIIKMIRKIANINPREISDTLIPADIENRDIVIQILRICYKN